MSRNESDWNPTQQVKEYLLAASKMGARLFRRNVGQGWIGDSKKFTRQETVIVNPGDVVIRKARPFHNGEAGQYDTYGFISIVITPAMVGTRIAQVVEIEAKQGAGRQSPEQVAWGDFVRASGGRAGVARSVADVERLLS